MSATIATVQSDGQHVKNGTSFIGFSDTLTVIVVVLILLISFLKIKKIFKEKASKTKYIYTENDRKALDLIVALANIQKKIDASRTHKEIKSD